MEEGLKNRARVNITSLAILKPVFRSFSSGNHLLLLPLDGGSCEKIEEIGLKPIVPKIKVANQNRLASAWEVLSGKKVAENKVLVMGGSAVALEAAELLAREGKEVTVIEEHDEVGHGLESRSRFLLLQRLEKKGVKILKNVVIRECQTGKVILVMGQEGREKEWETELIVSALPPLPCQRLANELSGMRLDKEIDIHMIGDCLHPRSLYTAIHDGYRVGREV